MIALSVGIAKCINLTDLLGVGLTIIGIIVALLIYFRQVKDALVSGENFSDKVLTV